MDQLPNLGGRVLPGGEFVLGFFEFLAHRVAALLGMVDRLLGVLERLLGSMQLAILVSADLPLGGSLGFIADAPGITLPTPQVGVHVHRQLDALLGVVDVVAVHLRQSVDPVLLVGQLRLLGLDAILRVHQQVGGVAGRLLL